MNWIAALLGAATLPFFLSLICLAVGRPKTIGKAAVVSAVVVFLMLWLSIEGGTSLQTAVIAALLAFSLAIVAYYLARRLLIVVVNHDPAGGQNDSK